jgi:hypothetical protein
MLAAIEAKIGIQVMFIASIPFILAKIILQVFLLNCIRCLKSLSMDTGIIHAMQLETETIQ